MRRSLPLALIVPLALLAASCSSVTEIVVDVTTDLPVPARVDELRVVASVAGGAEQRSTASLVDRRPPRRVVLVHAGGPLGPVRIRASAHGAEGEIISAERSVAFEPGRSVAVLIALEASCVGVTCPGAGLCQGGRCVDPCELSGVGCPDAGPAIVDPPSPADAFRKRDAAVECTLDDGLCGVPGFAAPGDLVRPVPCTAPPAGVLVTYETRLPSGGTSAEDRIRVDTPGSYTVIGTASAPAGCRSPAATYEVATFSSRPNTSRPGGMRRDFAARLDMAFVAAQAGPFAVTDAGWSDLSVGASGALPSSDERAVTVIGGHPVFAAQGAETDLARIVVRDDFVGTVIARVVMPGAARTVRSLDVPLGEGANGDMGPLVAGSDDGLVLGEGPAESLVTRILGASWDINRYAAVGGSENGLRGAVWSARGNEIRNDAVALSGVMPFAGGKPVHVDSLTDRSRALAVDDGGTDLRLWLCTGDAGLGIYDLASLAGPDTLWPAARATVPGVCNDVAIDPRDGSAWLATPAGLRRVSPTGELLVTPGLPTGPIAFVAVAWGDVRRQVWVLSAAGDVSALEAGL